MHLLILPYFILRNFNESNFKEYQTKIHVSDCNHIYTVYKRHEGTPREEKQKTEKKIKKKNTT